MKRILYLIFSVIFVFVSCESSDGESAILSNKLVDISDFTMYKGAAGGGVEVEFNNLKKVNLMKQYFGSRYVVTFCDSILVEFSGNRLTYTFDIDPRNLTSNRGKKIISNYAFRNDSLFVIDSDKSFVFVALGSSPENLHRRKSLVRYPYQGRDTIRAFDEELDLNKVLNLAGKSGVGALTNTADTIAWCNITYYIQ